MRKSIDIAIATFGIRIEWVERMLLPPIEGYDMLFLGNVTKVCRCRRDWSVGEM